MDRLLFSLVLLLAVRVIYLITGRNRRQIDKIPEGMALLCQPPGKRYVVYALGVFVVVIVMVFGVLYLMDGAPEGIWMWGKVVAFAVGILILMIFCGNVMARDCIYFDSEKIQIEKAFKKPRFVKWHEICKIKGSFDNTIHLYRFDGTKILTADVGMVNFEAFCGMLRKKCPGVVSGYYQSKLYGNPKKCILRYGLEYYILAGMGILILLEYLAIIGSADDINLLEEILHSEPTKRFSLLFAPVCGVVSLILLFVMCNTKIRYSEEKLIIRVPLKRKCEICWRNIQKIEVITAKKQGKKIWKKLRLYTGERIYRFHLEFLTYGRDDFVAQVLKMVERYDIAWTEKGR